MNGLRPSPEIRRKTNLMKTKYRIFYKQTKSTLLKMLKQCLCALNNRLFWYQRRQKDVEDVEKFWKPPLENKKVYNKDAPWLQEYTFFVNNSTEATYSKITSNEIESAKSNFSNWKSPELERLHNFWWNKLITRHPIVFDKLIEELKPLELNQQYKYLGFGEGLTINKTTKSAPKNEYFKQLKMILKSELSSKSTFEAIDLYAITALWYGFPMLNWTITELEIIDRETRKIMPCIAKATWLNWIYREKTEEENFQKAQQYGHEIGHYIQQLAAMGKLPPKITIKSARINKPSYYIWQTDWRTKTTGIKPTNTNT